jgi:hypothetical protein
MALRALITTARWLVVVLVVWLSAAPALACFGPKLYFAVADEPRQEVLFALVSLYVHEKTGVDSVAVAMAPEEGGAMLAAERVDLAFTPPGVKTPAGGFVFTIGSWPRLVSGKRPLEQLQFTTVLPAIRKLNGLLSPADVEALLADVRDGDSAIAAARRLLMARRWI